MTIVAKIGSTFFVESLNFSEGKLEVLIRDTKGIGQKILFDYVRSYLFFKESDFWAETVGYETEPIVEVVGEESLGVFRILKKSMTEALLCGRIDSEEPSFYLVSTPDECLEVVTFEAPTVVTF